jgi:hypothetical protein
MCPECDHSWSSHCWICHVCHHPARGERACGCSEGVPKRKRNASAWNLGRAPIEPPMPRQRSA